MSRLWDRWARDLADRGVEVPEVLTHVDATAASDIYWSSEKEAWRAEGDFPGALPPWTSWWMEFRAPLRVLLHPASSCGTDAEVRAWAQKTKPEFMRQKRIWMPWPEMRAPSAWGLLCRQLPAGPGRWGYLLSLVAEDWPMVVGHRRQVVSHAPVETDGVTITTSKFYLSSSELAWECGLDVPDALWSEGHLAGEGSLARKLAAGTFYSYFCGGWLALSLINAENIQLVRRDPDAPVVRRARKKGYPAPVSYHVIEIRPGRTKMVTLPTPGARVPEDEAARGCPLSIVRGHFRIYGPDAPLFGKLTGTFWTPMYIRGAKEHGVALKDYVVGEPLTKEEA